MTQLSLLMLLLAAANTVSNVAGQIPNDPKPLKMPSKNYFYKRAAPSMTESVIKRVNAAGKLIFVTVTVPCSPEPNEMITTEYVTTECTPYFSTIMSTISKLTTATPEPELVTTECSDIYSTIFVTDPCTSCESSSTITSTATSTTPTSSAIVTSEASTGTQMSASTTKNTPSYFPIIKVSSSTTAVAQNSTTPPPPSPTTTKMITTTYLTTECTPVATSDAKSKLPTSVPTVNTTMSSFTSSVSAPRKEAEATSPPAESTCSPPCTTEPPPVCVNPPCNTEVPPAPQEETTEVLVTKYVTSFHRVSVSQQDPGQQISQPPHVPVSFKSEEPPAQPSQSQGHFVVPPKGFQPIPESEAAHSIILDSKSVMIPIIIAAFVVLI